MSLIDQNSCIPDAPWDGNSGDICLHFTIPRDPGSPDLRMVSWKLNTLRFGSDYTSQWWQGDFIPRILGDEILWPFLTMKCRSYRHRILDGIGCTPWTNLASEKTLPETNSSPLKIAKGPQKETHLPNHQFSGAFAASFRGRLLILSHFT